MKLLIEIGGGTRCNPLRRTYLEKYITSSKKLRQIQPRTAYGLHQTWRSSSYNVRKKTKCQTKNAQKDYHLYYAGGSHWRHARCRHLGARILFRHSFSQQRLQPCIPSLEPIQLRILIPISHMGCILFCRQSPCRRTYSRLSERMRV